jgi:hypothetical protein
MYGGSLNGTKAVEDMVAVYAQRGRVVWYSWREVEQSAPTRVGYMVSSVYKSRRLRLFGVE